MIHKVECLRITKTELKGKAKIVNEKDPSET